MLGVLVVAIGWGFWLAAATSLASALAFDYFHVPPPACVLEAGKSGVRGRVWGTAVVGSSRPEPLPPDTEARVGDFADLVATAIANAQAHAELTASRARIVAAGDDARRRFERDLHDGAQQRLVSLALELRTAEASVLPEHDQLRERMSHILSGLADVSEELREMSHGIHPAILSKGGLGPARKALSRRSAVPVKLHLAVERRSPESAEVAAYYVVAEALTNAAKHARASEVDVRVEADDDSLRLSVRDDGIGGAAVGKGSGLTGLMDRVEALDGTTPRGATPRGVANLFPDARKSRTRPGPGGARGGRMRPCLLRVMLCCNYPRS
jgi:signal transduction histidine kinase